MYNLAHVIYDYNLAIVLIFTIYGAVYTTSDITVNSFCLHNISCCIEIISAVYSDS